MLKIVQPITLKEHYTWIKEKGRKGSH